jgi:hypothetical protein
MSNGCETLTLRSSSGELIQKLDYDDEPPWPRGVDGAGFSLQLIDPRWDATSPASWRNSAVTGGTPGRAEYPLGDANLDGRFNSSDLVQVFAAGQYEDALAGNSTWSTGDWNGDGEFTTSDLVLAFQVGQYVAAAIAAPPVISNPQFFRNEGLVMQSNLPRRTRHELESLEPRRVLAGTALVAHPDLDLMAHNHLAEAAELIDLDGDQDLDVVAIARSPNGSSIETRILWQENLDGQGTLASTQSLWTIADQSEATPHFADVEGDGDLDILVAEGNEVFWLEHVDGRGRFERGRLVITLEDDRASGLKTADVNADGILDIVYASQNNDPLRLLMGTAQGDYVLGHQFGPIGEAPVKIIAHDLDGDGDLDVMAASLDEGSQLAWYRNVDGTTLEIGQLILTSIDDLVFDVGDVDGDGDSDLITAWNDRSGTIDWHENNGQGMFQTTHRVSNLDAFTNDVSLVDADGDGDLDVLLSSDTRGLLVLANLNGQGQFNPSNPLSIAPYAVGSLATGDLDGDLRLDLLATQAGDVILFQGVETRERFREYAAIIPSLDGADVIGSGDMDGDGDQDLVVGSDSGASLEWYENDNGQFVISHSIVRRDESLRPLAGLAVGDADADGDVDVVVAAANAGVGGGALSWFANRGDGQRFDAEQLNVLQLDGADVQLVDLDGDGDEDWLLSRQFADQSLILWQENNGGPSGFPIPVAAFGAGDVAMHAADLDGDGDRDVVASFVGSGGERQTTWYQNLDGNGTFLAGDELVTDAAGIRSLSTSDLDGDGDTDIVAGSFAGGRVLWYENQDGQGSFGSPQLIAEDGFDDDAVEVQLADVDGDGDDDLVATFLDIGWLAWYERLDGPAAFGPLALVTDDLSDDARVVLTDLDGDGDLDFAAGTRLARGADGLSWFENRVIGDANDDGRFDSSDLVRVFQAGKYEDGIAGGTTFDEGDWNGDGEFNSSDLVLAFQAGTYTLEALPDLRAVAAAVDRLFAKFG